MPMEFNVKAGEHAKRELTQRQAQMSWFNEGKWTLTKRAEQILTGVHWAEEPLSRVCRMVSNVQLTAIETNAEAWLMEASPSGTWSTTRVPGRAWATMASRSRKSTRCWWR